MLPVMEETRGLPLPPTVEETRGLSPPPAVEERPTVATCHDGNERFVAVTCCGREALCCRLLWRRDAPLPPATLDEEESC